jgi:AraC family transcriptional regulator
MPAAANRPSYEDRLRRVLIHIHDNLDGDLSLDALAEVACMSRFHWHRVFKAMTGETPAEAIRRIRLLKAANALVLEDTPLPEIAEQYGYADVASFSRAFSAAHGVAPGTFRTRGVQLANELRQNTGDFRMYPVTIETLPSSRAAGVLNLGPYTNLGRAFQQLGGTLATHNLFSRAKGLFAIYHDSPGSKPDAKLRSHAAIIIGDDFPANITGFDYFDIAGGRHAIMAHRGPYATLAGAYEWLYGKWLPRSGEELRDAPPIEFYVNDPRTTPPEDLRTDIRLPLA